MKFLTITPLLALLSFTSAAPLGVHHKRAIPNKPGWTRNFYDDFTGPAGTFASSLNWNIMQGTSYPGGPANWGNNEVQTYRRDYSNVRVTSAQTLSIRPTKLSGDAVPQRWASGRIESIRSGFRAAVGGKLWIESNIRLGNGATVNQQGIWPAFWAMGEAYRGNYNNWPGVSEWDFFESINGQNSLHQVLHCGTAPGGICNEFAGIGTGGVPFIRTNWNVVAFQIDRSMVGPGKTGTWRDEELSWWLNGVKTLSIKGSRINNEAEWVKIAHTGHYLIFNVAVGGNWPGSPNTLTRSHEATGMEIDYVGVWNSIQ